MYIPKKVITCENCGCEVLAAASNQKYCRECSKNVERKRDAARLKHKIKTQKPTPKRPVDNHSEIVRPAKEARERGLSYGQRVAMGGR